jgi:hypothetical protein
MGLQKKSNTGSKKQEREKTVISREETAPATSDPPPDVEEPHPTAPRLDALRSILTVIDAPPQIWPQEALKAILKRFERVPRKRWDVLYDDYTRRFGKSMSMINFKKQAESAIIKNNGVRCNREEFAEESAKRIRTLKDFIEENTLQDLKLYNCHPTSFGLGYVVCDVNDVIKCVYKKFN